MGAVSGTRGVEMRTRLWRWEEEMRMVHGGRRRARYDVKGTRRKRRPKGASSVLNACFMNFSAAKRRYMIGRHANWV